jgi:CobQ-like glutamine amidotransferase family enzyme
MNQVNEIIRKDILAVFEHDGFTAHVVWVEYSGGGMSYEFEIIDTDNKPVVLSENGYGQPLPAAAGAYQWFTDYYSLEA